MLVLPTWFYLIMWQYTLECLHFRFKEQNILIRFHCEGANSLHLPPPIHPSTHESIQACKNGSLFIKGSIKKYSIPSDSEFQGYFGRWISQPRMRILIILPGYNDQFRHLDCCHIWQDRNYLNSRSNIIRETLEEVTWTKYRFNKPMNQRNWTNFSSTIWWAVLVWPGFITGI